MNLTYAYIFLVLAIGFEILATSFLKDTNGFTNLYPSLIVIIALCFCLFLMSHTMQFIPVGIVYATWAGLGIVGITIIAIIIEVRPVPRTAISNIANKTGGNAIHISTSLDITKSTQPPK